MSNPPAGQWSELLGVSCTSTTRCVAVGETAPVGPFIPLVEEWNGATWSLQTAPLPAGAPFGWLNGVSCNGPSACTAAGRSLKAFPGYASRTLIEHTP